jgi:anthranilate phosphoribosyltransferase
MEFLQKLAKNISLTSFEIEQLAKTFFALNDANLGVDSQVASDAQIGAFLMATALRQPTVEEVVGMAKAMKQASVLLADPIFENTLDTCGTGGSGLNSFNTSTAVAFVLAASGQKVVKHGNRAITGKSGSADLLEDLGIRIELSEKDLAKSLEQNNFCFLFAPRFHPATRRVAEIRKELGFKTIFNFLGPLVNPANPRYQLLGVSSKEMHATIAESLLKLETVKCAWVVRGRDGLDELSLSEISDVYALENGAISSFSLDPLEFGLPRFSLEELVVSSVVQSSSILKAVFNGEKLPQRYLVLFNSAAALVITKQVKTMADGLAFAQELIDSGRVLAQLNRIR